MRPLCQMGIRCKQKYLLKNQCCGCELFISEQFLSFHIQSKFMAATKAKTTQNNNSVKEFIKAIPDKDRQQDAFAIAKIMESVSGFPAKMWGPAIIGFGTYHYKYDSGHEGDAPVIGFSPRKDAFALYLSSSFDNREELLKQFGKHKTGKACIYIKKLTDIDVNVFEKMVTLAVTYMKKRYDVK